MVVVVVVVVVIIIIITSSSRIRGRQNQEHNGEDESLKDDTADP